MTVKALNCQLTDGMSAAYLQAFANNFLKTYQTLLRSELTEDSKKKLYDIALAFGDLAIHPLAVHQVGHLLSWD